MFYCACACPLMRDLALYIHWPFCKSKCPYCDFNSHVRADIDEDIWEKALLKELNHLANRTGKRQLRSIFFGGGTPSLMRPATVNAIINQSCRHWTPTPDLEITLEANPNSVEVSHFQELHAGGINRVSIGIQALDSADLQQLGRHHTVDEGIAAITTGMNIFKRVSFDLIYARPHQTLEEWERELSRALSFGTEHLSLYQLTIEPGTAFAPLHQRGELVIPDDDLAADFYKLTDRKMLAAGLPAYEISNYARAGYESRHNLCYWHYGDYAGVGPGAHGRLSLGANRLATRQYRVPETWLRAVEKGSGEEEALILSPREQAMEAIMMGLRLTEGIPLASLPVEGQSVINRSALKSLVDNGYLHDSKTFLQATFEGRLRLNSVLKHLLD
jgi:putative oxygen-independent coproporphyrinogen III oxidase